MQNDNLQDEKTSSAQNPSHSSFLRVFKDTLVISMMSHVHCQAPGKRNPWSWQYDLILYLTEFDTVVP